MTQRAMRDCNGRQQITRVPPYRPGDWVKIKDGLGSDLSGKIRRVRSITCSINSPEQKRAIWRVHFDDGRGLEWHLVERFATPTEVGRVAP